jgi:UDP-glucose 4-epimerase
MSWTDIPFHKVDVRNKSALTCIFEKYTFDGIIHFAGLKSVSDSVENLIND